MDFTSCFTEELGVCGQELVPPPAALLQNSEHPPCSSATARRMSEALAPLLSKAEVLAAACTENERGRTRGRGLLGGPARLFLPGLACRDLKRTSFTKIACLKSAVALFSSQSLKPERGGICSQGTLAWSSLSAPLGPGKYLFAPFCLFGKLCLLSHHVVIVALCVPPTQEPHGVSVSY